MSLFQPSVLKKYLSQQDSVYVQKAYGKYTKNFHNNSIQGNIRNSKEEQFQEGFLRELFVDILGYTLNPAANFNLTTELKNIKGAKKLENWCELTFANFINELNKAIKTSGGIQLTKKDEIEWINLFEEYKKQAQTLKQEIDKTDKEIDKMVYELYGLSEEEIEIVENS